MEQLIETIRSAVSADATDEARAEGVTACRTILAALEAKPGEPLVPPTSPQEPAQAEPPIAAIVGALRGMPPEQLLDLAIARLRAALPAESATPAVAPVRFQLIPIAPLATQGKAKGGKS